MKIDSIVNVMLKRESISNEISELKKKVIDHIDLLPCKSEDDTVAFLSLYFTAQQLAILFTAMNHVPFNFPNSTTLILNICMASSLFKDISQDTLSRLIAVLGKCEKHLNFWRENPQNITRILWKASKQYKEPYLQFENPPVQQCVECSETLYPYDRICVTFHTVGGPIPGQRGILKCKKCRIYYHLTGYTVPNQGKTFYTDPITSSWICASNRVFFHRDLHEFMCESRYDILYLNGSHLIPPPVYPGVHVSPFVF
jgi:hypothetical protein